MSMEDIIRAWKADEEALEPHLPTSPVGRELSEQELLEVVGGGFCPVGGKTCGGQSCSVSCTGTCAQTN